MKFNALQQLELEALKEDVTAHLLKYGATRTMKNLRFDILNMKEDKYKILQTFKVSLGWISKLKKRTLKPTSRSIVKEVAEKKFLEWFKKRKQNMLSSLVTTQQAQTKWKSLYGKTPSRYALKNFREKYSIKVVFDKTTRNTNSWIFY